MKKPTLVLTGTTIVLSALLAMVLLEAARPVTGDWRPELSVRQSRVEVKLRRIVVLPWSEAIAEVDRDTLFFRTEPPRPDDLYLFVEYDVSIDGGPLRWSDERVKSFGQIEITYDGRPLETLAGSMLSQGKEPNVFQFACGKIGPWRRGFGRREFVVDHSITLEPNETIDFRFHVPAR